MLLTELGLSEVWNNCGAVIERRGKKLDHPIFVSRSRGRSLRRLGILQPRAKCVIRAGNMQHELAERHRLGMRPESIFVRRHRLGYGHGKLAERREVLRILPGGRRERLTG